MPGHDQPLRQEDQTIEGEPEQRPDDDGRPGVGEVKQGRLLRDVHAQGPAGAPKYSVTMAAITDSEAPTLRALNR